MVDELNTNMKHWWNDAEFEKENTWIRPCPSATLSMTTPDELCWDQTQASGDRLATKCLSHGTTFIV